VAPPLLEHLEKYLGRAAGGVSVPAALPIQVLRFDKQPATGATTFVTLGLSEHLLKQEGAAPNIRHELVFCCRSPDQKEVAALLSVVAEDLLRRHRGLARGEVLGPAGKVLSQSSLTALYCAAPVYYPEGLAVFRDKSPHVYFIWLVPLATDEAAYVRSKGWSAFEERLLDSDPDLLDLQRLSIFAS
jgi:Suppressor of fused protein (SUFU)